MPVADGGAPPVRAAGAGSAEPADAPLPHRSGSAARRRRPAGRRHRLCLGRTPMDIRGHKLVVIGGAGLIGSHTVDRLLDGRRAARSSSTTTSSAARTENLDAARCRTRACASSRSAATSCRPTSSSCGARRAPTASSTSPRCGCCSATSIPRSAFDVNVRGTFNVLEACVAEGREAARLLLVGLGLRRRRARSR